jgi:acyl carrier protein
MRTIDQQTADEIRDLVVSYFAEECDIDRSRISDETNIISDLEGDSVMLLSLLEIVRKKYGLTIELKTLGRRLMQKPANTVGQVVDLTVKVVQYGNDIAHVDL